MPAFVDWNSLLFGSAPPSKPQQVAPQPELDASTHENLDSLDAIPEIAVPEGALLGSEGRRETETQTVTVTATATGAEDVVLETVAAENRILENAIPEIASAHEGTVSFQRVIDWSRAPENTNGFTIGAILLGTILLWLWVGRRKKSQAMSQPGTDGEEIINAMKKDFAQKTEAFQKELDRSLKQQAEALEERFQHVLNEQTSMIEEHVRKSVNKRVETLEVRIKLDQEALDDVHRALSERLEAFEGYVRTIDAKQLDQEANSIAQLTLSQRLDTVEEGFRNVESKARSSAQRIEALDDSVRVIDTRAKALSQRVEATEDNLNTADAQVTLLSHDVNRGSSVIEKLQRQVKMLPDSEKFKGLSRSWEAKIKKLETKLDETHSALEEHLAEPPPSLTWSHIEFVEIEPSGPLYTRPHAQSFDESLVSPSSSSVRSHSTNGSHTRTYSTVSSSPAFPPMTPERRRIDTAGFRETTFSSRQKLLAYRTESWSG
ncbi:hypothetical protein F4777DRAFT_400102 [Nemania sp. FL0916]|nr:hypothetical protein F4777DRAFT_400102 [Nemania sp. FL0916]